MTLCTWADLVDGSPAHLSAKVQLGHRLLAVDGQCVHGCTLIQVAQRLEGRERSTVSVTCVDPRTTCLDPRTTQPNAQYQVLLGERQKLFPFSPVGKRKKTRKQENLFFALYTHTHAHTHTHTHTHTYVTCTYIYKVNLYIHTYVCVDRNVCV